MNIYIITSYDVTENTRPLSPACVVIAIETLHYVKVMSLIDLLYETNLVTISQVVYWRSKWKILRTICHTINIRSH